MVLTVTFTLAGQGFAALNGGPEFRFDEAISFLVDCKDQEEVDYFWNALLDGGGKESQCGWLKDRYGVSWQIIPEALGRLMGDPDPEKARRVTEAMLKMVKIDVAELERAYAATGDPS
jgi:predicted 3-demethylubiquinone-9 3-methyltransferase (glyoxalase superfamily)